MTSSDLITFLKSKQIATGFIDNLKITLRPLICPLESLLELIPKQSNIFDIGCGSGQFCLLLANYCEPKQLAGIEISQTLIDNANQLLSEYGSKINLIFQVYDGKTLPTSMNNYDYFFMIDVLHHIPKEQIITFLENVYAQMPKGATFILKDMDGSSPLVVFNKLHDLIFAREIGNEISANRAKEILEKIGFQVSIPIYERRYVYQHYTLIAKK
jgi:cyclopropane fatty-acyl-phospholipid synthase-like methyltransferase